MARLPIHASSISSRPSSWHLTTIEISKTYDAEMPSSPSSGRITTCNALPPLKQQKKFPERRRSAKLRPNIPRLRKTQSTLTQLDFITPTSSRAEAVDTSSDQDFEEPRPKKKRRRKSKFDETEARQSTLTQFDRQLSARKAEENFELDEDGFQIWEDYDPHMIMDGIAERQHTRRRTLPWLRENVEEVENREPTPEIPETSQNVMDSSGKAAVDVPTTAVIFQTPRKVRFQEVPSSQTPPSTVGSVKALARSNTAERSPLNTRSSNVQSAPTTAAPSPESQNVSMKMLERIRFGTRKVPLNDMLDQRALRENASALDESVNAAPDSAIEAELQPLSRIRTIQDSQSEDAGLSNLSSGETVAQPLRRLQRVSTVQDSQFDEDDFLSEVNEITDDNILESHLIEDSQYVDQNTQQDYFDPANSALDRDALRFGCTQTQRQLSDIDEEDADDETDDEDLDRGCSGSTVERAQVLDMDPQVNGLEQPYGVPAQRDTEKRQPPLIMKPHGLLHARRPDSRDDSAYESGDMANHEEVQVISSSPPPRPSQVSTVVPTQASLPHPTSRNGSGDRPLQNLPMMEPLTLPLSPHKPIHHSQILSSSPFPLPPWSSPDRRRLMDKGDDGDESPIRSSQLARLVDYSLPPPPPLSSSGRQTPISSST